MKLNIRYVFSFLQPIKKLVQRKLVRTHSCRIEIGREPDFVMVIIFLSNLISIKLNQIHFKPKSYQPTRIDDLSRNSSRKICKNCHSHVTSQNLSKQKLVCGTIGEAFQERSGEEEIKVNDCSK